MKKKQWTIENQQQGTVDDTLIQKFWTYKSDRAIHTWALMEKNYNQTNNER